MNQFPFQFASMQSAPNQMNPIAAPSYNNDILPRILIVDDDRTLNELLGEALRPDFHVLVIGDYQDCLDSLEGFDPRLVLLGVRSLNMEAFDTCRRIRTMRPTVSVVFHSVDDNRSYIENAAKAGGNAFLSRRSSLQDFAGKLQALAKGEFHGDELLSADGMTQNSAESLTMRQLEVLRLIASGCTAKEIASTLKISVRTAEFHRAAIMNRLNLHSTAQMTCFALEHGFICFSTRDGQRERVNGETHSFAATA